MDIASLSRFNAHHSLESKHMQIANGKTRKRPINLTLDRALIARARAEGLNLSALAEQAVTAELLRRAHARMVAEIAQACDLHERYLAEYGSLSDAVRSASDATP